MGSAVRDEDIESIDRDERYDRALHGLKQDVHYGGEMTQESNK